MAYKQKGFPTHMSTIQKSPAKQWDWYDENVADQGYLAAAGTGASYGAQVGGPWGAVIGGVIGVGAQVVKNEVINKEYPTVPHVDNTGWGSTKHGQQLLRQQEMNREFWADNAKRNQELAKVRSHEAKVDKLEDQYKTSLDPNKMAQARIKLEKMQNTPRTPEEEIQKPNIDNVATSNIQDSTLINKAPTAQLNNRAGRPQNNGLNPITSPFSTNQYVLNGNDPTNLAVKYAQFNSIAQDLTPITPIQQTEREERKAKTKAWNEKLEAEKQAKYDLKKRAKEAGVSVRKQKAKEFWDKGPKVTKSSTTTKSSSQPPDAGDNQGFQEFAGPPTEEDYFKSLDASAPGAGLSKNQQRYKQFLETKAEDNPKWSRTPMGWSKGIAKTKHLDALTATTHHGTSSYEEDPVSKSFYLDNTGNFVEK